MSRLVDAVEVIEDSVTISGPTSSQLITISAPTDKKVLSGGLLDTAGEVETRYSYPSSDGSAWNLEVFTNASGSFPVTASAVCIG